jgi:CheY-like chemotaxis protein
MAQAIRPPVLVVEDNDDTRDVLQRVLQIHGYDVVGACDGVDALGYLRSGGRAAAIVLDITMPHMDGIAFRRELSADRRFDRIPIIVYTANPHRQVPDVFGVYRKGTDDPNRLLDMLAHAAPAHG